MSPAREKWCAKCRTSKPLDAFWRNRHAADGRQAYCVECQREGLRARYVPSAEAKHLPAGPLVAYVERRRAASGLTVEEVFEPHASALARAFYRASKTGRITRRLADVLVVRVFAEHPVVVWPDEWYVLPS